MPKIGDSVLVFANDSVKAKTQQSCGFTAVIMCFLSIDR